MVQEKDLPIFVKNKLALGVSAALLITAALSWIASYYFMPLMMTSTNSGMMTTGVAGIVSSVSFSSVALFEIIWVVGMAAMMFPAMIPMVLFYNRVATKQENNPRVARYVGTPLFLSGYLLMYAVLGLSAFFALYELISLSMGIPANLAFLVTIAPAAVLIITGIYQFTPLKSRCLSKCSSPLGFFAVHLKKGLLGSLDMGVRHGLYCVGCCWAFMFVMLAVGAMSLPVMAILAGVIALEKVLVRGGVWLNRVIAAGFIIFGLMVFLYPGILAMI